MSSNRGPRTWGALLFALSCAVLAFGLYAVGPGGLYMGDSLPDYAVIGLAAAVALTGFARWAALGSGAPWDWKALRGWSWLATGASAVVLVLVSIIVPIETGITRVGDSVHGSRSSASSEAPFCLCSRHDA
jgi:hypothetical protein